ncbi:4-(cytidine 5'-diphospho)-2-C-methyl-D-erythritol kinase [Sneathiella sp. HT1-7]|uniref:4-(cytidine 5'-diphospho)-2-C-methyl-D-erythritol kinase n=1 Tax=Sneathiella sp. HT1-7 TaxID=2887192 RepID=UPI001D15B4C3|nr:4-(cytidine 5'-diphospho)-2-C-methyl-D-erythritol kinase [Sneathiella sp. HT1-7]MCC3303381.1 4-(cytidine 5'-diphospho)-2-C-methyl-D-erythritol kinase [Sneathiella sp. HT1-7]
MITAFARSKVNLFLHVTGKRNDGYHLLESLVVFPEWGDRITVKKGKSITLEVTGPFSQLIGSTEENLAFKAAHLLKREGGSNEGARIVLEKNLPVAAGIGGGSADAAAVLKSLNVLWNIGFSNNRLGQIGLALGADVPVCLYGKPAMMSGIGEQISGLREFPKFNILLVNPGISASTGDVFSQLTISEKITSSDDFSGRTARELFIGLAAMRNDLEAPALEVAPVIDAVLSSIKEQKGCHLARMSGSGATCFGLFEEEEAAEMAARDILERHPDWWVQAAAVDP